MKKTCLVIALVCVMVFAFAATAMADHSPLFYFDFQGGRGSHHERLPGGLPAGEFNVTFDIDNGSWASEPPRLTVATRSAPPSAPSATPFTAPRPPVPPRTRPGRSARQHGTPSRRRGTRSRVDR